MGLLSVDLSARDELKRSLPIAQRTGIEFPRYFTAKLEAGKTPYDEVSWEMRTATIGNDKGAVIFEQRDVEVPADWSQTATNIVASKYFHGKARLARARDERGPAGPARRRHHRRLGLERASTSRLQQDARELPQRTGAPDADPEGVLQFAGLVQRRREGNPRLRLVSTTKRRTRSTSWRPERTRPQCSACFIVSVKDSLESILDLAKTEGMLFKWGSGTGTNLSALREEDAILSGGGRASGPLSFMKGFDAFAGVIKSRRQDPPRGQDGDPERRPSGHREVHLVQGEGREEGPHADRRRLRFVARRRSVQLDLLPERQQHRARHRRVHASRRRGRATGGPSRVSTDKPVKRYKARDLMRQIAEATLAVRRSRHAVRYHRQPLAHLQEHGAHQRVESLLGVHVPGRFGLQPGVAEPDEVRRARTGSSTSKRSGTRWTR